MRWRRYGYAVAAILIVLIAGDVAYWFWTANRLRAGIQAWIAARSAEGWHIQTAPPAISGWPKAVIADLRDVRIDHDRDSMPLPVPLPLRFRSAEMRLRVSLYDPARMTVSLRGEQHLAVAGAQPMVMSGDLMQADLPLTEAGDQAVTFQARGLRVGPEARGLRVGPEAGGLRVGPEARGLRVGPEAGGWTARIAAADGQIAIADQDAGPPALDFAVSADSVELPAHVRYPLGPSIHDLSVKGTLHGPFPQGRALPALATAWRDGGGSVEVRQADLTWGPLHLSSTATLALDDQLQPMGSGSAKVSGYEDALNKLAASGVLTKSAATVANAMLSLLAGTASGDTPSEVDVPLTLQFRTLSMRQVPLLRLPELDWRAQ